MRNRLVLPIVVLVAGALLSTFALAAPGSTSRTIPFQGRLELAGVPTNGSVTLGFEIFADAAGAGAALWSGTFVDVALANGAFAVLLGSAPEPFPSTLFENDALYVAITVDGQSLNGLQKIESVGHAVKASEAYDFKVVNTLTVGGGVDVDGAVDVGGRLTAGERIGAGTTAPALSIDARTAAQYGAPSIGGTASNGNYVYLHIPTSSPSVIWRDGAMRFGNETSLGAGYVERMRIQNNGDVVMTRDLNVSGITNIGLEHRTCDNVASGSVCTCPAGKKLLGGGAYCFGDTQHVNTSYPPNDTQWQAWCEAPNGTNVNVRMTILCARVR